MAVDPPAAAPGVGGARAGARNRLPDRLGPDAGRAGRPGSRAALRPRPAAAFRGRDRGLRAGGPRYDRAARHLRAQPLQPPRCPTILTSLPTRWRRKAVVGAASDYFFDTWYRSIATTIVFNAFPIARSGGLRSARMARQLISEGWSLVLFPEGSRTPDGWVGEFRTGAAWLAMEAGGPVVPVALIGAYQAMPRGRSWPKPGRPPVRIRFGLPIRAIEGERAAAFSERLRQGLGKVLEEAHSNWWNAIRLDAAGELFDPGGPQVATWRRMWESSRPVRPSRARSVWSPDTHEWEAEHLWSGA